MSHKHEDLSVRPQNPHQAGCVAHTCNLRASTVRSEIAGYPEAHEHTQWQPIREPTRWEARADS